MLWESSLSASPLATALPWRLQGHWPCVPNAFSCQSCVWWWLGRSLSTVIKVFVPPLQVPCVLFCSLKHLGIWVEEEGGITGYEGRGSSAPASRALHSLNLSGCPLGISYWISHVFHDLKQYILHFWYCLFQPGDPLTPATIFPLTRDPGLPHCHDNVLTTLPLSSRRDPRN